MEAKKVDNDSFICPYCNQKITELIYQLVTITGLNLLSMKPKKTLYACPHCKKVLPGPSA